MADVQCMTLHQRLGAATFAKAIAAEKYILERSSDLLHWTAVNTNTADSYGKIIPADPQPIPSSPRFYRLL